MVQVARETGHLDGVQEFRSDQYYGHFPADKVLALCTGSQGEPRAALARIARDDHPQVTLNRGDTVIFSSRTIPGNEKAVGSVINGLITQGIEVITDRTELVHVSGHEGAVDGARCDLRVGDDDLAPRIAVHLARDLAKGLVVEQELALHPGEVAIAV